MKKEKITKKDIKWLEKIFGAEIENRLPFQSESKDMKSLQDKGLIQPLNETMHFKDGLGSMLIKGWQLTHYGRLIYCMSC